MVKIPLMQIKKYSNTNSIGIETDVVIQGRSIGIRIRGKTTTDIQTAASYTTVCVIPQLNGIITKSILKRVSITGVVFGQLSIQIDGTIKIGFTFDSTGQVDIKKGATFYIEEGLVLI